MNGSTACRDSTSRRNYVEIADSEGATLRVHYLREGDPDAPVILLMHGEPSWCYLYRKMIPVLTGAGLQVVAPDLVGFGRSDKPGRAQRLHLRPPRRVDARAALRPAPTCGDVTLVGQDWGGLIGLRLVGEHPEHFARVVAANTFLPTGDTNPGDAFFAWQRFSQEVEVFPTGVIVKGGCVTDVARRGQGRLRRPVPRRDLQGGRTRSSRCSCRHAPTTRPTTPTLPPGWAWPRSTGPSCAPSATKTPSPGAPTATSGADRRCEGPAAHDDRGRRALPPGRPR